MRCSIILFLLAIFFAYGCANAGNVANELNQTAQDAARNPELKGIALPEGFEIDIFASDLGKSLFAIPGPSRGVRLMEFHNGVLFASLPSAGAIVALPDKNKDGKSDEVINVVDGLNRPHGITFKDDYMFVANEDSVIKVKIMDDMTADKSTMEHIVDLPSGGHWTRTIRTDGNNLFVSIGSSCNACIENDERRASILKCALDGDCKIYARGIRNAVGFVFHPDGNMYATENSRDWLGNEIPPDEINSVEENMHYGWPYCYGKNIPDAEFDDGNCASREPSFVDLQAHSAPLGLAFNFGDNFPEEYKGDLFAAYHGSWNRDEKTGYKVVSIDLKSKQVTDFAEGWLKGNEVSGRPVDIVFDEEGIMYVSDDFSGRIYRIWHNKK